MNNPAEAMKALDMMREDLEKTEIPKFEETKREKGVMMNAFEEMISRVEDDCEKITTQIANVQQYSEKIERKRENLLELKQNTEEKLDQQKKLLDGCRKVLEALK